MTKNQKTEPLAAKVQKQGHKFKSDAFSFQNIPVEFTREDEEKKPGKYKLKALTGKPFYHPFWGNLAIDLSSLKVPKQKIPTLLEHRRELRIGFTETIEFSEKKGIDIEGQFLMNSEEANKVMSDAQDGFPFEASVAVPPEEVEFLRSGESTKVNGHKLNGPGTVFIGSTLEEVSFVSLGADPNTKVSTFGKDGEAQEESVLDRFSEPSNRKEIDDMSDSNTGTQEAPAQSETSFSQKDLDKAGENAVKKERDRISAIQNAAFAGQEDLVKKAIDEGWELSKAQTEFIKDQKENGQKRLAEFQKDEIPDVGANDESSSSDEGGSNLSKFDPDKEEYNEARFSKYWDEEATDEFKAAFDGEKDAFLAGYKHNFSVSGTRSEF